MTKENDPQPAPSDACAEAQDLVAGHTNSETAAATLDRESIAQLARNGRDHANTRAVKRLVDESKRRQQREAQVRQVISALKATRLRRNMTIAEVAEIAGVDKSVISRFENEITDTRISTLLRYAEAVEIDFWMFVGDRPVGGSRAVVQDCGVE